MRTRRRTAEATLRRGIRGALKPEVSLVASCMSLLDRAAAYTAAAHPQTPWRKAQTAILSNLADLSWVFRWSIESGYRVPAMALGASMHELGYLSAFIADQSDLAARWLQWKGITSVPWRRKEIWTGAHRNATGREPGDPSDFSYAMLAMAKHGNPNMMARLPAPLTAEERIVESHPLFSAKTATRLQFIIVASLRSAVLALLVLYSRGHLPKVSKRDIEHLAALFLAVESSAKRGASRSAA
jgi:hypothetical protein